MIDSSKQFISTAQYARTLGISVVAVFKRIQKGQIKAVKVGRSYVIPCTYLEDPTGKFAHQFINVDQYVSVMQAAKMLGLTRMAVFNKIKTGVIQAEQVGRHYIISVNQLEKTKTLSQENIPQLSKEFVSIPELAKAMGVSRIAIFKKVQKDEIKARKVGRHYVIARTDIIKEKDVGRQKVPGIFEEEKLSLVDVAQILGISRIAVFKRIQKGQLKAEKIGRSYAVSRGDLVQFQNIITKRGSDV